MNIVKNIRSNSETAADIRSDLGTAPAGRTTRRMDFNPETLSNPNISQGPRRGATPEEDLRRMQVREDEVYRGGRYTV